MIERGVIALVAVLFVGLLFATFPQAIWSLFSGPNKEYKTGKSNMRLLGLLMIVGAGFGILRYLGVL